MSVFEHPAPAKSVVADGVSEAEHLERVERQRAQALARVEILIEERDKAREDCGWQRKLKESTKEELSRFVRLKQERDVEIERLAHVCCAHGNICSITGGRKP